MAENNGEGSGSGEKSWWQSFLEGIFSSIRIPGYYDPSSSQVQTGGTQGIAVSYTPLILGAVVLVVVVLLLVRR